MKRRIFKTAGLIFLILTTSSLLAVDIEENIIQRAQGFIGTPYVYGGVSPSGFDCSGFVYYIYKDLTGNWPRVTREQGIKGIAVNKNDLLPGDLTFWATGSDPRRITHVSIYLGNDSMIHALSEGPRRGIAISSMNSRYWTPKYLFSRRIFPSGTGGSGQTDRPRMVERQFPRGKYVGYIEADKPQGEGTYYLNNGDVYTGEFSEGNYHGTGKYTAADGNIWEGTFVSGKINGRGTRTWPSGSRYEGAFTRGAESGGWFTAVSGRVRWVLKNRRGEWEVYEDSSMNRRIRDTAPAFNSGTEESITYILEENPWDEWNGVINFPADWETGSLFETTRDEDERNFQDAREAEKEAFRQYQSGN